MDTTEPRTEVHIPCEILPEKDRLVIWRCDDRLMLFTQTKDDIDGWDDGGSAVFKSRDSVERVIQALREASDEAFGKPEADLTYGHDRTIHGTQHLDVETHDGEVVAVWFRCMMLPFEQRTVSLDRGEQMVDAYLGGRIPKLLAVTVNRDSDEAKTFSEVETDSLPQTKAEAQERGMNGRGYRDFRGNTIFYQDPGGSSSTEEPGPEIPCGGSIPPSSQYRTKGESEAWMEGYRTAQDHQEYQRLKEEAGDPPVSIEGSKEQYATSHTDDPASPSTKEPLADAQARVLYSISSDQTLGGTKYRKFIAEIDTQGLKWGRQLTDLLTSLGFDLDANLYSEIGLFNRQIITFTQYQRRKEV